METAGSRGRRLPDKPAGAGFANRKLCGHKEDSGTVLIHVIQWPAEITESILCEAACLKSEPRVNVVAYKSKRRARSPVV